MEAAHCAGKALYRYALAATHHDDLAASHFEAEVRALVPEVVASAEPADTAASNGVASLADARMALAALRSQQQALQLELENVQRRLQQLGPAQTGVP